MRYTKNMGLLFIVITVFLAACGSNSNKELVEGKTNVVTSFYPLYYLASEIGGDNVNVVNLIPAGVEPHDWTPKSQDLTIASKAQLFLYNGAGLEGWTDDFLTGLPKNSGLVAAEMSKGIEMIHGNPEEDEHEDEGHDHDHDLDVDPHTWVSPKSAIIMAANVRDSLVQADAAHKDEFEANYKELVGKLEALNDEFETKLATAPHNTIVVSHQAFGYLARDYGLKQIAITGLSPDAEPRPQDLLNVAKLVKSEGIKYIYFEELVSRDLANTIADETNTELLVLNPIEGLTPKQEKAGEDYLSLMEQNLQNLLTGLQ
jgi:zinc transport system substrate-binding protein